jgi:hypothetical protein
MASRSGSHHGDRASYSLVFTIHGGGDDFPRVDQASYLRWWAALI